MRRAEILGMGVLRRAGPEEGSAEAGRPSVCQPPAGGGDSQRAGLSVAKGSVLS